jgi:hypothetical protein
MGREVTARTRLLSWDPKTYKESSEEVATPDEVAKRAADLLERYKVTAGRYPGLQLETDNRSWGSLAIGVAPFGWTLIHSSEDGLTQHCTKVTGTNGGPEIPIEWDQETTIPRNFFVSEQVALKGVRQWLKDGTLAPDLPWDDHCY